MQTVSHVPLKLASLFGIAGKVALVTGGGRGIGEMIARTYVENGAKVYITSRREDQLRKTAEALTAAGPGSCHAIPGDLSTDKGVRAVVDQIAEAEKKLHILVNNSGISWGAPFDKFPETEWDRVLGLNVKSPFLVTRALRPLLEGAVEYETAEAGQGTRVRDPARVINIGSVVGIQHQPVPTYSYDVSKAAVHALTKKLAAELAPRITVNAIAPGFVPSRMSRGLLAYASEERLQRGVPMGRLGSAADMGGAAVYLASPAGAWVTGHVLLVDGGSATKPLDMVGDEDSAGAH